MKPPHELAEVIRLYGDSFITSHDPLKHHQRTLHALSICRTAALGGHVQHCDNPDCKHEILAYNSCRNRHCPKCQHAEREKWIAARMKDLLDCTYFHLVFTIPEELNTYCLRFPKQLYHILFQASKETLFTFGHDPKHLGAQMGAVSILHTWGQNLTLHPHVHMIVPGGGFTKQKRWKTCASNGDFLFPIKAMATVYRGKFLQEFLRFAKQAELPITPQLRKTLYSKNWVVYAKRPFQNPAAVVEYLSRYTHRVAISNHRLKSTDNGKVSFSYKDYAHGAITKIMTLDASEFLRRFCLHNLSRLSGFYLQCLSKSGTMVFYPDETKKNSELSSKNRASTQQVFKKKNMETHSISKKRTTSPSAPAATREHSSPSFTSPQTHLHQPLTTNSKHMQKTKKQLIRAKENLLLKDIQTLKKQ